MFSAFDHVVSDDKAKRKKPSSSSLSSSSRRRRGMMVIVRIQDEDVRCVGGDKSDDGSVKGRRS